MTNPRKYVEKALGDISSLLGETPESVAAVAILRDLTETAAPGDAAYCLTRIALAIEVARQRHGMDQWNRGYHAGSLESHGDEPLYRADGSLA